MDKQIVMDDGLEMKLLLWCYRLSWFLTMHMNSICFYLETDRTRTYEFIVCLLGDSNSKYLSECVA